MITISIDAVSNRATIQSSTHRLYFTKKRFELICALLVQNADTFLFRDMVAGLPYWRAMMPDSIGKEIARLISHLESHSMPIIQYRQRTNGWRMSPIIKAGLSDKNLVAAQHVIDRTQWSSSSIVPGCDAVTISEWFKPTVLSLLEMTKGQSEGAKSLLRTGHTTQDYSALTAISDMMASRIGQRLPRPELPVPPEHHPGLSPFQQSVEARRFAAYALRSASDEWPVIAERLLCHLEEAAGTRDFTTKAILHNAAALVLRRLGQHADALTHIKEAAPLAIFSGDIILIQNVAFNFGNILSEMYRVDRAICAPSDFIALLQIDVSIRDTFGLGQDSAQAELLIAFLLYEQHSDDAAQQMLEAAMRIIAVNKSQADEALFNRVSGLLEFRRGQAAKALQLLTKAAELFFAIGNAHAAEFVQTEIAVVNK